MAARGFKPDGLDLSHVRPARSSSFSSDVMSNSAKSVGTAHLVPHANPAPAYIAQTEASDLISAELDRKVLVSQPALTLLNEFLDHVSYNIISTAHSVALGQLKAAVPAVLKPRLGKAALRVAEDELKEYIEDEEAEELYSSQSQLQPKTDFDTDLVWKLARLRCMVYARMGDLEEEDEEEWLEKEHLLEQAASSPLETRQSMAITPGSAIFLTSVIEYLGEQALYYAAQYAQRRQDNARTDDATAHSPESQLAARHADIVLEGRDMNHVGRDSPLSRLWRSWRRNTRSPVDATSRPMSPENILSPGTESLHSRTTSASAPRPFQPIIEENRRSATETPLPDSPSQIPLPMGPNDIDEIEGLVTPSENLPGERGHKRPTSMPVIPGHFPEEVTTLSQPAPDQQVGTFSRPQFQRKRSNSLPVTATPFEPPAADNRDSFVLPIQGQPDPDDTAISEEEDEEELKESADARPDTAEVAMADTRSAPKEEPITASGRPQTTQTPEQLNATVGVLAGALGAVGIHQVGRHLKPSGTDQAEALTSKQPTPAGQSLTSASIKGPGDFDMMHVPEGRLSPEQEEELKRKSQGGASQRSSGRGYYQEIAERQLEEHKRYSQQAHQMDTPSIYSHHEHSPRVPKDPQHARPEEPLGKEEATIVSMTDPEPRPSSGKSQPSPRVSTVQKSQEVATDSPASPTRSDVFPQRVDSKPQPIVPTPQNLSHVQPPVDEYTIEHARGHSKSSSSSSRLLGFTRDAGGRPQTIHQQRAAGDMSDDIRRAHTSTQISGNKSRPETANSASPPRRQHLRLRGDSDNNTLRASPNDEATKRSLEVLINSGETLHYTLTPATATFSEEDLNASDLRTQTHDRGDLFRSAPPPSQLNATPKPSRSRKVSLDTSKTPVGVSEDQRKGLPSPILRKPSVPRAKNPLGEPRDAKVDLRSGVRDLADYVRSTGPTNEDQLPKALTGGAVTAYTGKLASTTPANVSAPQKSPPRPQNRLKFQARDPRPSRSAEASALIDFIREGPPREQGDHRIDRHIAPFRTTMDSDDLNALASTMPKGSSETNGVSVDNTTVNSNAPLINHAARVGKSAQPPGSTQTSQIADTDGIIPKKHKNRVKDPYALDDSDDDLFNDGPNKPAESQEESLIDFLRNTAPLQDMTAQPILSSLPKTKSSLNRSPSVDRLKDFVRGGRSTAPVASRPAQIQAQSQPRAESPHLTQSGSKLDSYRPTQTTHAAHVDRNRSYKTLGRSESRAESRASTVVETRSRATGYGETADLAEYLRNTGPSPSSQQQPQPFMLSNRPANGTKTQEKDGGLKKFFSIRGKNR